MCRWSWTTARSRKVGAGALLGLSLGLYRVLFPCLLQAFCLRMQLVPQLVWDGDTEKVYEWPYKNERAFKKSFKSLCLLMKTAKLLCSWLGLCQLTVVILVIPDQSTALIGCWWRNINFPMWFASPPLQLSHWAGGKWRMWTAHAQNEKSLIGEKPTSSKALGHVLKEKEVFELVKSMYVPEIHLGSFVLLLPPLFTGVPLFLSPPRDWQTGANTSASGPIHSLCPNMLPGVLRWAGSFPRLCSPGQGLALRTFPAPSGYDISISNCGLVRLQAPSPTNSPNRAKPQREEET